jgi:endonuclease V-like protein UPF0215 family
MPNHTFGVIKPEIRVLGVDDGPHEHKSQGRIPLVGVVFRGGYWLDGVLSTEILVDGFDATDALIRMVTRSRHFDQLRIIMLNGVTFAGFNIVDINRLYETTKLPVIAVTRKEPNMENVKLALNNLSNSQERLRIMLSAGDILPVKTRKNGKNIYLQTAGISKEDGIKVVKLTSTRSNMPEPLRVAHLVASGVSCHSHSVEKV